MAKTAAATIYSDIKGTASPSPEEMEVLCILDMGRTAAFMKASPLLPPRQESYTKKGVWAKWLKVAFERYFIYKMKHGLSNLP
jgi:sulfide:quinone oxidoreductase